MREVRRFKIISPETIRRVCKYRLNKRGKRSGKKGNNKTINCGYLIQINETSSNKVLYNAILLSGPNTTIESIQS